MNNEEKFRKKIVSQLTGISVLLLCIIVILSVGNFNNSFSNDESVENDVINYSEELEEIKSLLKSQDDFVDNIEATIERVDGTNATIIYKYSVSLKEYTHDSKVSVTIGDEMFSLKNEGSRFVGEIPLAFDTYAEECVITVEDNGVIKNQGFEDDWYENSYFEGAYELFSATANYNEAEYSDSKIKVDFSGISYSIADCEKDAQNPVTFKVMKGDEVIYEKEISDDESVSVNEKTSDISGGSYKILVSCVGKSGLTYEYLLGEFDLDDDQTVYSESLTVYDKYGIKIFNGDEY